MERQYVYLDLKDWIAVGRDFFQREKAQTCPAELEWLLDSVATGKICFPLVDTLFLEFYKHGNPTHRARLARIMSVLSLGYVISDKRTRLAYETRLALAKIFKYSKPMSEEMVVRGISRAFISDKAFAYLIGLNPINLTQIIQATDTVEAWIDYFGSMDEGTRKFLMKKFSESNQRHTAMLESFRKSYGENPDISLRVYYARLFSDTQTTVLQIMDEYGLSKNDLLHLDGVTLSSEIPSFEIEAKLTIEAMKQHSRRLAENDCYDISSLACAIPYCSVVVTEAFWVDLCKRHRFDQKYNCKLLTNYKQLSKIM